MNLNILEVEKTNLADNIEIVQKQIRQKQWIALIFFFTLIVPIIMFIEILRLKAELKKIQKELSEIDNKD
jgi:preprotein translocase subunit YajC